MNARVATVRTRLDAELAFAREQYRFWARQDGLLTRDEREQKAQAERQVLELEARLSRLRKPVPLTTTPDSSVPCDGLT